jgi:hypothetical protein
LMRRGTYKPRPPAAQLLFDLGVEEDVDTTANPPQYSEPLQFNAPYPPMPTLKSDDNPWTDPAKCKLPPLPLRHSATPPVQQTLTAVAARTLAITSPSKTSTPHQRQCNEKLEIMTAADISRSNMAMIYMSPDPFFKAFEQPINLRDFNLNNHPTAGFSLYEHDGRLFLATMSPSTPAAKIPDWHPRVRGAWLIKVGHTMVNTIGEVAAAFQNLQALSNLTQVLLFAHPEIRPNLSHDGLPIVSSTPFTQSMHDQLNNRWEFSTVANHLRTCGPQHQLIASGNVLNFVDRAMRPTQGKLIKQSN